MHVMRKASWLLCLLLAAACSRAVSFPDEPPTPKHYEIIKIVGVQSAYALQAAIDMSEHYRDVRFRIMVDRSIDVRTPIYIPASARLDIHGRGKGATTIRCHIGPCFWSEDDEPLKIIRQVYGENRP